MRYLILALLIPSISFAKEKHPIFNQIVKNSPKINKRYAMKLSNIIHKASTKFKIPAKIYTAILKQESNYSLKAKGCHTGMREFTAKEKITMDEKCELLDKTLKTTHSVYNKMCTDRLDMVKSKVCTDFGISQIFHKTAERYNFNIEELTRDLRVSVYAGAEVLSGFKRYSKKDKNWWVRYNCGSRGSTKRDTCVIYKMLVERFL